MSGLAEATIRATRSCPGKMLLTSEGLGWTSLLVRITEFADSVDVIPLGASYGGFRVFKKRGCRPRMPLAVVR